MAYSLPTIEARLVKAINELEAEFKRGGFDNGMEMAHHRSLTEKHKVALVEVRNGQDLARKHIQALREEAADPLGKGGFGASDAKEILDAMGVPLA